MPEDKIYRIIDANINRAMEGLRVCEETVRFILGDKKLTLLFKDLRGDLKKSIKNIPRGKLLIGRKSKEDVGRKLYIGQEKHRPNIKSIFKANIKRSQEATRVLEEFIKLINPKLGKSFKNIRFKLYDAEKIIFIKLDKTTLF